jgi:CheY-like chemotaxis protein
MPKKILVADDEREILDLVVAAVKALGPGYTVITVSNGAELPEIIQAERPDLMILDILLPGIDGYSLQLQFAQSDYAKDIPVIIITALPAARSLFEKFPQVKLFLTKPFSTHELLGKIHELIGEES